jgi:hypothetical protein
VLYRGACGLGMDNICVKVSEVDDKEVGGTVTTSSGTISDQSTGAASNGARSSPSLIPLMAGGVVPGLSKVVRHLGVRPQRQALFPNHCLGGLVIFIGVGI